MSVEIPSDHCDFFVSALPELGTSEPLVFYFDVDPSALPACAALYFRSMLFDFRSRPKPRVTTSYATKKIGTQK